MTEIKKVSDSFSSGGQPTPEDLERLAKDGFKSVVNLRSAGEAGCLSDEQQEAEAVGLEYANVPLKPIEADPTSIASVLSTIEGLPTPVFFHCGAGARGSAFALIALATHEKLNRMQVLEKAQELGIDPNQPHLKQFLTNLQN